MRKNTLMLALAALAVAFLVYSFFVTPNSDQHMAKDQPGGNATTSTTTGSATRSDVPPNVRSETPSGSRGATTGTPQQAQGNSPAAAPTGSTGAPGRSSAQ